MSFLSPCVLPLVPGYLSFVSGVNMAAARADGGVEASANRKTVVTNAALFVLGFSAVFVAMGSASGALGDWLIVYSRQISIVLGVFTIIVGIAFLGLVPWMQRDVRVHKVPAVGLTAAPLLGVLFGLGWTPCIGPTLSAVQVLAFQEGTAARGALLSLAYSIGLGVPFILAGLAFRRMLGAVRWVRRHQVWVTRVGGIMLIAVGLLLVTGVWDLWVAYLRAWVGSYAVVV
jgi:cytochrome c-type biogenesis protein